MLPNIVLPNLKIYKPRNLPKENIENTNTYKYFFILEITLIHFILKSVIFATSPKIKLNKKN